MGWLLVLGKLTGRKAQADRTSGAPQWVVELSTTLVMRLIRTPRLANAAEARRRARVLCLIAILVE